MATSRNNIMIDAGDAQQNPAVVTGTFYINNIYASIRFDTDNGISFIDDSF